MMNTTCIHEETGISGSEVRGKKAQTKTKPQYSITRSTSNKSSKNMLQLSTTATLGVQNY